MGSRLSAPLRPLALLALLAGAACGPGAPSGPSLPAAPGQSAPDAGTPDAGTMPLPDGEQVDAGTPDGGTPLPSADGGTTDAGTPPDADGGSPSSAAAYDPRFVITRSNAPACAGIGPGPVPTPTRRLHSNPSSQMSCWGPEASDGQGDMAIGCISWLGDRGWFNLETLDRQSEDAQLSAYQLVPFQDGFGAAYAPLGPRSTQLNFAWFDGATWRSSSATQEPDALAQLVGSGDRALVLRNAPGNGGLTTQWYDAHGNPLAPPLSWRGEAFGYAGVDARGNALVTWRASGAGLRGQWLGPNDVPLGAAFDAPEPPDTNGVPEPLAPLIGGGFVLGRAAIFPEGQPPAPVPAWLAARPGPFTRVNGGRAYAFFKSTDEPPGHCDGPTVTLVAPDGTVCGTISLLWGSATCPQPARVGVDGTLIQVFPTDQQDPYLAPIEVWRWWPGLFR